MSRKELMEKESECVESIFQSYINLKSKNKLFIFTEGKDDYKYYGPRIKSFYNGRKRKYNCKGKENVIKIHQMITNQSSKDSSLYTLFFVDRDYGDNSTIHKDIYITPTYSIENLYFTDNAIEELLSSLMGVSDEVDEDTEDFNKAINYIIDSRDKLIDEMIFGNACYSLQIKKAKNKERVTPDLTVIKTYNDIKKIKSFSQFQELIDNSIELSNKERFYNF